MTHRQAAVLRGAALRGLEGLAPHMKYARRHYGIIIGKLFRQGQDDEKHAFIDPFSEEKYCEGRIDWMVRKVGPPPPPLPHHIADECKGDPVFYDTYKSIDCCSVYIPNQGARNHIVLVSSALAEPQGREDDDRE